MNQTVESRRLAAANANTEPWRRFGPYLSERQWGTVREDYSPHGNAWEYLPHDHARSRAYRWGEDGLAGISEDQQRLCLSLALWNGKDPIFKERLFGLTNSEGNHGEDAKELYYYLDATPTHSYLKMLYKYPQREFPYGRLVEENRRRGKDQPEFELLDTGIFEDDRYFDVFVEYAKADAEDILMLVTVHNRGPETATIHLLPQLWFRNTWSWKPDSAKPILNLAHDGAIAIEHPELRTYRLYCDEASGSAPAPGAVRGALAANTNGDEAVDEGADRNTRDACAPQFLFCDNETNVRRLYDQQSVQGHFKDAFHEYVVNGNHDAVNPNRTGTKAAAHYELPVAAHGSVRLRLRLTRVESPRPFADFDK